MPHLDKYVPTNGSWQQRFLDKFTAEVCSDKFPCTFTKWAWESELIFYSFVSKSEDHQKETNKSLESFFRVTSNEKPFVLIVFYEQEHSILEEVENFFWSIVEAINSTACYSRNDEIDFQSKNWRLKFYEHSIFITAHMKFYKNRLSRYFSEGLYVAIQRRDNIDVAAPDSNRKERVYNTIRNRLAAYDKIPMSPIFGTVFDQSADWEQFMLPDTNDITSGDRRCPLINKSS